MIAKARGAFSTLKPGQKRIVVALGLGAVMTVIGIAGYIASTRQAANPAIVARPETKTTLTMDGQMLATSELQDAKKDALLAKEELERLKNGNPAARAAADGLLKPGETPPVPPPAQSATPSRQQAAPMVKPQPMPPVPSSKSSMPPPAQPAQNYAAPPPPGALRPTVEAEIGGILHVTNNRKPEPVEDKKKDEKKTVYLPRSYMEATLLSGLDAPTSSEGKSNPVPVLIRVKTPAVLPNEVKANLRGCFMIADGKGNLGTERAELIVNSISCIDRKGQSVIDQDVVGYVVDADGKAGLRGHVVTKMGAVILRATMAGMFSGFGDAINSASTTSSVSALGTTQSIEPKDVAIAGLGRGVSSAFKELQKFYLDLAHQTLPVIEIGAARPITVVLTKGTSLEIKKIKGVN